MLNVTIILHLLSYFYSILATKTSMRSFIYLASFYYMPTISQALQGLGVEGEYVGYLSVKCLRKVFPATTEK